MSNKPSTRKHQSGGSLSEVGATRRAVLATGGAVALGSLAGCVAPDELIGRVSEQAVENRRAAPAAFYTGDDSDAVTVSLADVTAYRSGSVDVRFVPPTLRVEGRELDIDGWSTTTTTRAQNHNSSRSNRTQGVWWAEPDGDHDEDDDDDTLLTVLDMERALLIYVDGALSAIEKRARDDASATLAAFVDGVTEVQAALKGCPSETCVSVLGHADGRLGFARAATAAVEVGEWDSAERSLRAARRLVETDIEDITLDLDSDNDGLLELTADLYGYLEGEATIGEQFVVSLPDARLRGDGPALVDDLTPGRVLEYFVGEQGAETCGESDRRVAIHRDIACRDLLTATLRLEGDAAIESVVGGASRRRGVATFQTSGGGIVTGASPAIEEAAPIVLVSGDGQASVPESLDAWGEEQPSGTAEVTGTFVVPVAATPPDCPCPMPALLCVKRIRHDDQLLFVGGWHVDNGALYENAATLLHTGGPAILCPISLSDIEAGSISVEALAEGRKRPGRTKYGNITLKKTYDPGDDFLPAGAHSVCRDDGERSYWAVQSRESLAKHETGICPGSGEGTDHGWGGNYVALDAPVVHLVETDDASNEVKFKAGAELSKAVN